MKILGILPSTVLYGKERSNIEVFNIINCIDDVQLRLVLNSVCDKSILQITNNLNRIRIIMPRRDYRVFKYIRYFALLIYSNISLVILLFKLRPNVIYICEEKCVYEYCFIFYFYRGKILYRLGDTPRVNNSTSSWLRRQIWNYIVNKKVDKVVCISEFVQKGLQESGRDVSSDSIVYNFPPSRNVVKDEDFMYHLTTKLTFGYIGRINKNKGVLDLIRSYYELKKDGIIIGLYVAGSLDYDKLFIQEVRNEFPLIFEDENVKFLGEINNMESFFSNVDILCVPSIFPEPLGNVLVEAKTYSTPCIIYPTGGMPELISHNIDGYLCPNVSVESLKEAMLYYVNNTECLSEQSFNSKQSLQSFGIERSKFEEFWQSIVKQLRC